MERERDMPEGTTGDTESGRSIEEISSDASKYKEELGLGDEPTEQEIEYIKQFRRQREIQEALERESLERARAREREFARSGVSRKERENALAERAGLPAVPAPGYKYEWIHSQQLGEVPVKWRKEREEAEKDIKKLLGRIEIAKSSITEQMQVDIAQAKSVLEVLEVRTEDEDENGVAFTLDQLKEQQDWASKMRLEIRTRIDLHQAFYKYEIGAQGVKDVIAAVSEIPSAWMDVIFGLEEKIPGTEETFNPFVEALQYYEDHGHEFARHNIATKRVEFGKKVQAYVLDIADRRSLRIDPYKKDLTDEEKVSLNNLIRQRKLELEIDPDKSLEEMTPAEKDKYEKDVTKKYEWAQNMAERLFRTTGRAIMYDYLVVNKGKSVAKGDKVDERMVDINYQAQGDEKIEWAGGRDGCDYAMSKILRFRENLASSSEWGLMRPHIELLDGVDTYGGDFWSRLVRDTAIKKPNGAGSVWRYRVRGEDLAKRKEAKVEDLMKNDNKTRKEAEEIAEKLYCEIDYKPDPKDLRAVEDYEADIYADRETSDNSGEMVGWIDFKQMERKKDARGNLVSGIHFEETMGDSPWGLWTVRRLNGSENVKKGLTENAASFLLNPNFESLSKLISAFDDSKENAWLAKEQLLKNLIKYGREKIAETGRQRWSKEEILAGVNKLTGLTDPNAPQFIQLPERMRILADYFGIEISKKEKAEIEQQAREQAEKEIAKENPGLSGEEREKAIANRTKKIKNSKFNDKLNGKIESRINRKFLASFGGNFLLGALKGGLKQALEELGIK